MKTHIKNAYSNVKQINLNNLKIKSTKVALVFSLLIPFFANTLNIKAIEKYDSYIDEVNEKIIISEEGYYVDLNPLTRWMFENDRGIITADDLPNLPDEVRSFVLGRKGKTTASANGAWSVSTNQSWIGVSIIKDSDGNTLWCLDASKTFPNGNGYTALETADNQGMWNLIAKGVADGIGYADIQIAIYAYLAEQSGNSSFVFSAGPITITCADVRTSQGGYLVDYGHASNFRQSVEFNTNNLTGTYNSSNNTVESQELIINGFMGAYSVTGLTNGLYLIDAGTGNRITDPNYIPQGWTVKVVNSDPSMSFNGVNLTVTSLEGKNAIGVYYTSHDASKQNLGRFKGHDPIAPANVVLNFEPAIGDIEINKTDANGNALPGADIALMDANNQVLETKTTDATGKVVFTSKVLGDYKYQETNAPKGYVLDTTIYPISLTAQTVNSTLVNTKQLAKLEIFKSEDSNSTMYVNQMLANAEYTLTKADGTWSKTQVTDANGYTAFTGLEVDTLYKLQETKAPEGYVLDTTVRDVFFASDQTKQEIAIRVDLTNKVIEGNIYAIKSANNGTVALNGAIFGIYRQKDDVQVATLTSGSHGDGMAISNKLRFEKEGYYVQEIKAPKGYWLDETKYSFSISTNNEIVYKMISNEQIMAKLQARKIDSDTKLPLEGVKFRIADMDGNFVTVKWAVGSKVFEASEWTTDVNGEFTIEAPIVAGDYLLVETAPLEGYLPMDPIPFTIDENQDYINLELVGKILNVGDIENQQIKGCIEILKVDKDTKAPIPNTTFELYNSKLELLRTVVTGDEGIVTVCDIAYGTYYIKEVDVPAPYIVMDQSLKEVKITEHGRTEYSVFENEKEMAVIKILKTNDSGKLLPDVEFEIRDEEGTVIQTLITDKDGLAESQPLELNKKYTVVETKTVANHILDTTEYTYEFEFKDKETPIIYTQLDVVNVQEKPELPETGQTIDLILSAVSFAMVGLFLLGTRKRFNN